LKLTTPKTPTEGTGKKATGASKSKQSAKKGSKAAGSDEDAEETGAEAKEPEKPIDPQELKNKREKEGMQIFCFEWIRQQLILAVLYIRHKLQKGFISRDSPPNAEEMTAMSNYISKLESYGDLEVAIIRVTKINKVLKMIVKLNSLPRDEELQIRQRAMTLLSKWRHDLEEVPTPGDKEDKAKANGHTKEDSVDTPTKEEEKKLNEESNEHVDEPMPDVDAAEKPKDSEEKPKEAEAPKEGEVKGEEKAEKAEEKTEEKPEEKKTEDKPEEKAEEKAETEKAPGAEAKDQPASTDKLAEEQPEKQGEKTEEKKAEEKAAEAA